MIEFIVAPPTVTFTVASLSPWIFSSTIVTAISLAGGWLVSRMIQVGHSLKLGDIIQLMGVVLAAAALIVSLLSISRDRAPQTDEESSISSALTTPPVALL